MVELRSADGMEIRQDQIHIGRTWCAKPRQTVRKATDGFKRREVVALAGSQVIRTAPGLPSPATTFAEPSCEAHFLIRVFSGDHWKASNS